MDLRIEELKEELILILNEKVYRKVSKKLFLNGLRSISKGLTEEEFLQRFRLLEEKVAKSLALRALSRRSLFSLELAEKLEREGICEEIVANTISYFQEQGYLNDSEHMHRLIAKQQRKGLGKKAVLFKLKGKKGVEESLLSHLLQEAEPEEKVLETLLIKMGKKLDLKDEKIKQKVIAKLARRGFSYDRILAAINCV